MPEVYTPRLHIRLPTLADAASLAQLMTPSISARLASWPASFDANMAATRIAHALAEYRVARALPLLICRRMDGAVLGWVGNRLQSENPGVAVLTYWIGEAHHGQGLMREAAQAALHKGLTSFRVNRIHAAVQADNLPSRSVLQSLGMRLMAPGHIWCAARGRNEACEWWGTDRQARARSVRLDGSRALETIESRARNPF